MCGIAGIIGEGGSEERVRAMLHAMKHRGPDGSGIHSFRGGAFGMVRLALVDLSDRGQQPLWSPDGKVAIIFNGEMYNYLEHRKRLANAGYIFKSDCDTEVVLALYLEHPTHFVRHMRGMFALAIFDWRHRAEGGPPTVVLARDPFGIKPLYIARPRGEAGPLVFASELRALLASGLVPRNISTDGLRDYLRFGFVIQPRTMISGVSMMQRGALSTEEAGGPARASRFWTMPPARSEHHSFDEMATQLRAALEESIRLHAVADAPVGAFLSGGTDSSAIVALMAAHNRHLRTYTVRLSDSALDESQQAADFARRIGCTHTEVHVEERQLRDLVPKFGSQIDQPSTDGLNTWLVSRSAARDVKGVLSGLGGDEWFNGYPVAGRMTRLQDTLAGQVMRRLGSLANRLPGSSVHAFEQRLGRLRARSSPVELWAAAHRVFTTNQVTHLLGRPGPNAQMLLREAVGSFPDGEDPRDVALRLDVQIYMQSQLLRDSDATSMASSLELRVPFVDERIAAFARSCPPEYKVRAKPGETAKRVLVKAVEDLLPPDLPSRPKRGFAMPYNSWFRGPLAELVRDLNPARSLQHRGWISEEPDTAGAQPYPQAWALMILELWARSLGEAVH